MIGRSWGLVASGSFASRQDSHGGQPLPSPKVGYTAAFAAIGGPEMTRADLTALFDRHGILPTPQRIEIALIMLERPQHLSADQIIDRLRTTGSGVSKATVYNTLNLFSERGLVKEVMVDPIRKFYDSTTHAHHHFYNVDSGELSDIPDAAVRFAGLPELPAGTERESIEVLIKVRDTRD